jgi:5-oxopent-3-ene-1,2,5-tricarboxylate decarboxylase/2-hydroxyhepta-2,4-diene-1,7-dioate isomerase
MRMSVPPYRLSGTVYGTLLNHRSGLAAIEHVAHQPPYNAPPRAPVLYIKPRNTLASHGDVVTVPERVEELEVGGCLGVVLAQAACRLAAETALDAVAGYVIVTDISIPHASFYRPSIPLKCRDGFCPIGPRVTERSAVGDPDALEIRVYVEGELKQSANTRDLVRSVGQLLADVTDFMTLSAGDVLAVGTAWPVPRARAGQIVAIEIEGLGRLENRLEGAS